MRNTENYLPGDFIGCVGDLRKGKTMNAVRIAYYLRRRFGYPVVSNIPIHFPGERACRKISTIDEFVNLTDCVFVWDEIQASLDSRMSKSDIVIRLTQESILIGKRGIILIWTSPALRMVDVRYRGLTRQIYSITQKARIRGSFVSRVVWSEHLLDFDMVLMQRAIFPMHLSKYYGLYDTLYGKRPGETLTIGPGAAAVPARGARAAASPA